LKIFESQASYELSAVLTEIEALLYGEAFHTHKPISIPELGNRKFIIEAMNPCQGEGLPANSWHFVIRQETADRTTLPAASAASDDPSLETDGGK